MLPIALLLSAIPSHAQEADQPEDVIAIEARVLDALPTVFDRGPQSPTSNAVSTVQTLLSEIGQRSGNFADITSEDIQTHPDERSASHCCL